MTDIAAAFEKTDLQLSSAADGFLPPARPIFVGKLALCLCPRSTG
jgi:hypothetical protein